VEVFPFQVGGRGYFRSAMRILVRVRGLKGGWRVDFGCVAV
jgi:hypothetical protein